MLVIVFLIPSHIYSQELNELSNLRSVNIHNQQDTFILSSSPVFQNSFQITGDSIHLISKTDYSIFDGRFIWNPDCILRKSPDSLQFQAFFRVFPALLSSPYQRLDSINYQDGQFSVMDAITYDPYQQKEAPIFPQRGIQYDGSFSRGLSLGNRQDLVLNSNFDLRMKGSLGEDIEILAALSDNSIPLQPEGNTQQLQEFDKIFIQLTKRNNTLIGGDFELIRPKSYFINYFKKTQGVRFENQTRLDDRQSIRTAVSFGSSKGKFARINIQATEGNQGPYRLRGIEGERFIIVLANTEKIYLDGVLMTRGLEKDYVIDYNAGEISFTSTRIITKDSRIIAEYEYSDQNYNRSVYTFETTYQNQWLNLSLHGFSEQDGKLTSGLLSLNPEDKQQLAQLGDQTDSAFVSSIRLREDGYDPNIVMYKLIDTLGYDQVLVRSTDPAEALYTAKFTLVGVGQGDYIRVAQDANGEVFAWVEPDPVTQQKNGTHLPISNIITPKQRQMFAFGGTARLGRNGNYTSEISVSKNDRNRFSKKDSEDDFGLAVMNALRYTFFLDKQTDSISGWRLETNLHHEYISKPFTPLNPFRNAEFSRDWNLAQRSDQFEHLTTGTIRLIKPDVFGLSYQYNGLRRANTYTGNKQILDFSYRKGGFSMLAKADWLTTQDSRDESSFLRPTFDISQTFGNQKKWTAGVYFEEEHNKKSDAQNDTLVASSFYYDLSRFYLRKSEGDHLTFEVNYQKRWDYTPAKKEFQFLSLANDLSLNTKWTAGKESSLDATFTIRDLQVEGSNNPSIKTGKNYLGKILHRLNLWSGSFRTNTTYEITSGQEPKRTFQYLKVDPGKGVYTFIDHNEDGIQQINEFEIAPFIEQAEYIRVTVLTNEFIPTNNVLFTQSYFMDPRRGMVNKDHFLTKFSNQGSIRIQRKNLQNSQVSIWNPFTLNIADSALVSVSAQIRNVFYFNRTNPKYDIQYEWNDTRNRFILTTGYESKRIFAHTMRTRVNINRQLSGLFSLVGKQNLQDSESFDTKDYKIKSAEIKPELTWQPSGTFRLIGKYRFVTRKNTLPESDEYADIHDMKVEGVFNKLSNSSLKANFALVQIDFSGSRNSALEFAMLEGLKNGKNWLWGISYDRKIVDNIRLNISYDGRKTGSANVIHTARAQVSAFF